MKMIYSSFDEKTMAGYICENCGAKSPKWAGKCYECGSWNSMAESNEIKIGSTSAKRVAGKVGELIAFDKKVEESPKISLASEECSGVFGGGIVSGSLTLLSGEPGVGKSTLALEIANWVAKENQKVVYASGEENAAQILSRVNRLGIKNEHISLLTEFCLEDILATLEKHPATLVVIDSISVLYSNSIDGQAGSMGQIRYITEALVEYAKKTNTAVVLIGHITKDGSIGGPKTMEHMVDVVLYLEGVRHENYRILRALKNRFGPTDEIGLFSMSEKGMVDMKNPGSEFIKEYDPKSQGASIGITIEGNRPLLLEIEALTSYTKFGYPKRSSRGVPQTKVDLIIAVLTKYTDISLDAYDVYLNVSRGLSIQEPGLDLAVAAAIVSSRKKNPLGNTAFIGEVSLTGKIKSVFQIERRIEEAAKIGFEKIIVPTGTANTKKHGKLICEVERIEDLIKLL